MQWVPLIALCVTLVLCFLGAMRTALQVGTLIGELRKSVDSLVKSQDAVAMIPILQRDVLDMKGEVKDLRSRVYSDVPPVMREKFDSVNSELDDLRALPERMARLEARLSGERSAVEVPRPRRRDDRKDPE